MLQGCWSSLLISLPPKTLPPSPFIPHCPCPPLDALLDIPQSIFRTPPNPPSPPPQHIRSRNPLHPLTSDHPQQHRRHCDKGAASILHHWSNVKVGRGERGDLRLAKSLLGYVREHLGSGVGRCCGLWRD